MLEAINSQSLGFFGAIGLILGIWAIISIVQSDSIGSLGKAIWIVIVIGLNWIGFFLWLFFGPKAPKR
jgi:hypothetical protein